jgi:rubredoxin
MNGLITIKINFPGGIISPGDLYNICVAAGRAGIFYLRFGLRQQLLADVEIEMVKLFTAELTALGIFFEIDKDAHPNIVSSYPAEDVFINNTWLGEGIYKDILDEMESQPRLKINVSDSNQSFTPMLTGNINWVASATAQHFWHLFIRFPRTNIIYEWNHLVYTNDVPKLSRNIEAIIMNNRDQFYDNKQANGDDLLRLVKVDDYITKPADQPAKLPSFNLPYYEGLNRYNNNKYWLGVYRRDEQYRVRFLKALCLLCLDTKIGQLCSTPWKTIIVKGIEEKHKDRWNRLLEKHQVNMRHAANELNFQVEDNSSAALGIKQYLARALGEEDTRTFGTCIGIKTRRKSEVFCNILVRRRSLLKLFGLELFHFYDLLCSRHFNPNERTGFAFSRYNPRFLLAEQLRRCITSFYNHKESEYMNAVKPMTEKKELKKPVVEYVHQCRHCYTIYDPLGGEPEQDIKPGTAFNALPAGYCCPVCEADKNDFIKIDKSKLGLQPV